MTDRVRLISISIILFIYLMIAFPIPTTVISVVALIVYFSFVYGTKNNVIMNGRRQNRMSALQEARIYLSPYKDIWSNLTLSNTHCALKLGHDGIVITAKEKGGERRSLRVIHSPVHSSEDLWNMLCRAYDHQTTFDSLLELFKRFNVKIYMSGKDGSNTQTQISQSDNEVSQLKTEINNKSPENNILEKQETQQISNIEKTDINNASELELTELPGISIVMAKRLVKKREEIRGFKNIEDVFLFLKLRPHMESQLRNKICVNKMKGSLKQLRNIERSVDL